jgi:hypothetical protein
MAYQIKIRIFECFEEQKLLSELIKMVSIRRLGTILVKPTLIHER